MSTHTMAMAMLMRPRLLGIALLLLASTEVSADGVTDQRYETLGDGVMITPASGPAQRVRLQVMSERIMHVTALPDTNTELPKSLMVTALPRSDIKFTVAVHDSMLTLQTAQVHVDVSLATGIVKFLDTHGKPVLSERNRGVLQPIKLDGELFYAIQQQFNPGTDEAFYGLGQHQNAQMNYNGEDVVLAQHNMDVAVPFVISSRNYGLLWDNNSITRFGDPHPYALLSRDLQVLDANGKPGGFTARYYVNDRLKLTRTEPDINYQYLKDLAARPVEMLDTQATNSSATPVEANNVKVVWQGKLETNKTGMHRFRLYASSYFKLYADDKLLLNGWRQNWNPWYHNIDLPMQAGKPVAIRVEWISDNGYIALLHNDPLPTLDRHSLSFASEAAHAIDYYYVAGDNLDQVIAGYRKLTGKAVMLPRWAYGYWQSRQRYKTQDELLNVVREYRQRHIPLDNIVEDWFYWREDDWGSHKFDPTRFPDPKGMIDQLHAMNAHFMISVWPKFYPATDNYKELDAKGFIYHRNIEQGAKDWVGKGYLNSFYDPYSAEARQIYWRQIRDNLNVLGVDAWWLDASEPDIHSNTDIEENKKRIGPTAIGPSTAFYNSYPLMQTRGIYEGERATNVDKRAFILTRSAFAGQQRNAAATWSGDVASRWDDLYNQIAAGVNFSMSGIPNWSFDIGGFALEKRYQKPNEADLAEWRELNLRWFQFGAFIPLFRSHGEEPYREVYNLAPIGSEVYNSLLWYDQLRYRLMPYIYTQAADLFHHDGTLMRGLVMDFQNDHRVRNIKDQYMFGPALLVSPVHTYQARARAVYLPAGTRWYNFYTGKSYAGGQQLNVAAPLNQIPLFVKAGSIVPMGPALEYTAQQPDAPLTLYIYIGSDGSFDLYEDDGVTYGYERGAFARIAFKYDDARGVLSIGARAGSYPGMAMQRTINVRWVDGKQSNAIDFDVTPDATVQYSGQAISIKR